MGWSKRQPANRPPKLDPNELVKCHLLGYIIVKREKSVGLGTDIGGDVDHWLPTKKLGKFHYIRSGARPEDLLLNTRFQSFEAPRWWAREHGFILGSE
jgi:hypothetical protein